MTHTTTSIAEKTVLIIQKEQLPCPEIKDLKFKSPENILYCSSDVNYTRIHFTDGNCCIATQTLKKTEEQLVPFGFFRIHKQFLVNMKHILSFNPACFHITLSNNMKLPIACRRKSEFKKMIFENCITLRSSLKN